MTRQTIGTFFVGGLMLAGAAAPVASVCLRLDPLGLAAPAAFSQQSQQGAQQQGRGAASQQTSSAASQRGGGRGAVAVMTLTTTGFTDGGTVALKYTQAGDEVSPPLTWSGAPETIQPGLAWPPRK